MTPNQAWNLLTLIFTVESLLAAVITFYVADHITHDLQHSLASAVFVSLLIGVAFERFKVSILDRLTRGYQTLLVVAPMAPKTTKASNKA